MKRKSILNPFNIDLPQPIDTSRLNYLVEKIRDGTASKIEYDEILIGHLRLAIAISSEYAWKAPQQTYDLISEAILAMCIALTKAKAKLYNNNITPYLSLAIRARIRRYMSKIRKAPLASGGEIPTFSEFIDVKSLKSFKLIKNVRELLELIEHCINHDKDLVDREYKAVIFRLKASRYTNAEIANIIGISESLVQKYISEVKHRYEKENKDKS